MTEKEAAQLREEVRAALKTFADSRDPEERPDHRRVRSGQDRRPYPSRALPRGGHQAPRLGGHPLGRRRVYALAICTGARPEELRGITAADVYFEHGIIIVNGRREDRRRSSPSCSDEPELRALLRRLVKERPTGPLVDCRPYHGRNGSSDLMKKDRVRAGLTRADLTRDDADQMPSTFHGLRHTAVTFWYVAGKDATWLKSVAGHTSNKMTQRCLDSAAMSRSTFGKSHGPLPASVRDGHRGPHRLS